jgi:hypothetical protein
MKLSQSAVVCIRCQNHCKFQYIYDTIVIHSKMKDAGLGYILLKKKLVFSFQAVASALLLLLLKIVSNFDIRKSNL